MELSKKALEEVTFHTRGRWYRGDEVDAFLEELVVSVDQAERERLELRQELKDLKGQVAKLQEALRGKEAECGSLREEKAPLTRGERICQDLEQERDELIAEIKQLRRFREEFRDAVRGDAKALLGYLEELSSDQLL